MSLLLRSLIINWLVSVTAGIIAVLYFFWFSGVPSRQLPQLIWILGTMMFLGFVIQGFAHFFWLRYESSLDNEQAWKLRPKRQIKLFNRILMFPVKAASLAIALWAILGTMGAFIFSILFPISPGIILMLILITFNCGGFATVFQMFLYRLMIFPHLEGVLQNMGTKSELLSQLKVFIPIRGKLLLLLVFLVFLIFGMIFSAGYGKGRLLIQEHLLSEIKNLYTTLEAEFLQGRGGSESFWEPLWVLIGGPARIRTKMGLTVVENKKTATPETLDLLNGANAEEPPSGHWIYLEVPGKEYTLQALVPWNDFTGELRHYLEIFFISAFLGGLILVFITYSASREFSLSLKRFTLWANHLSRGRFQERLRIQDDDDLALITLHLDRIRESLGDQIFQLESASEQLYNKIKKIRDQVEQVEDRFAQGLEIVLSLKKKAAEIRTLSEEQAKILQEVSEKVEGITVQSERSEKFLERVVNSWEELEQMIASLQGDMERFTPEIRSLRLGHFKGIITSLEQFSHLLQEMEEFVGKWREVNAELIRLLEKPSLKELSRVSGEAGGASTLSAGIPWSITNFPGLSAELLTLIARVEEVAEDTHLSSLNAAIRSTKAQEIGRSFTVISDEVRNLADALKGILKEMKATLQGFVEFHERFALKDDIFGENKIFGKYGVRKENYIEWKRFMETQIPLLRRCEQILEEYSSLIQQAKEAVMILHQELRGGEEGIEQALKLYERFHENLLKAQESAHSRGFKLYNKDLEELRNTLETFSDLKGMHDNIEKSGEEYREGEEEMAKRVEELQLWLKEEQRRLARLREQLTMLEEVARKLAETFVLFKI